MYILGLSSVQHWNPPIKVSEKQISFYVAKTVHKSKQKYHAFLTIILDAAHEVDKLRSLPANNWRVIFRDEGQSCLNVSEPAFHWQFIISGGYSYNVA